MRQPQTVELDGSLELDIVVDMSTFTTFINELSELVQAGVGFLVALAGLEKAKRARGSKRQPE